MVHTAGYEKELFTIVEDIIENELGLKLVAGEMLL